MSHAMIIAVALLLAAQFRPGDKAEKASEAKGWLAPTRIRLDFEDRTLTEVVNGINAQRPVMLAIRPERRGFPGQPVPPPGRYTIREPAPVTFWEAIDRVGRATQTWPASGNMPNRDLGILLDPASPDRGFVSNDGAFRVVVSGTYYQSNFQFAPYFYNQPGFEQPKADGSSRQPVLSAQLMVMAEPRLRIVSPVELIVREAVDDRDRSLIPAAPWRQSLQAIAGTELPQPAVRPDPAQPLDDPGKRIKRLAGSVSIDVADRKPGSPIATVEVRFDFADIPLP